MAYIFGSLAVILGIIVIIFICRFIRFLFENFIISKFLSFGTAIGALIVAFNVSNYIEKHPFGANLHRPFVIPAAILTSLAWLFAIGAIIFDVEWDGTFKITWKNSREAKVTLGETGGFFVNALTSLIITGFLYIALGENFVTIFFLLPIAIIIMNIIDIMVRLKGFH